MRRTEIPRQFMLGGYNAGQRHAASRSEDGARRESSITSAGRPSKKVAPRVPNWRYKETLAYVGSVFANMSSMDRKGRVKGPTISRRTAASSLPDKLKRFLGLFKHLRLWDDGDGT